MSGFMPQFRTEHFLENSLNPTIGRHVNHISLKIVRDFSLEVRSVLNVEKIHLYLTSRSSVKNDKYDNKLPRQMLKMLRNVGLSSSRGFFCRFRKGNIYI